MSTGNIRRGSDIDLHVFTDHIETLEQNLQHLHWTYEKVQTTIRKGSLCIEYMHIYLELEFSVELSVYPISERKVTSRSSTDGKPIKRLKLSKVELLC